MPNTNLYRIGGYAAIASGVLYILSLILGIAGATSASTPVYLISSLAFLVAIGVLTMTLMSDNQALAILAFVLVGATTIWSLVIDPTNPDASFGPMAIIYGLGFLIYGWLQYQGRHYLSTLGILALATGALSIVAGIVMFAGASIDIFGLLNLVLTIPFVIWLIWMGWRWLKGATAA